MNRKQLLGAIGGAAVAAVTGTAALHFTGVSPLIRRHSVYLTDGPEYETIGDVTKVSVAVVSAKVVKVGPSYRVPFDKPVTVVSPLPDAGPDGTKKGPPDPLRDPQREPQETPLPGLLKTDVIVEVVEVLKGDKVQRGQQLTITQLGGTDEHGGRVVAENDPVAEVGALEVLFLQQDPQSGKYFATGGGQGRFLVSSSGTLRPVDAEASVSKSFDGKTLADLRATVLAVR